MFDENPPTNPKLIVADILKLADGWKELLGPEEKPAAKKRRVTKRASKAKS